MAALLTASLLLSLVLLGSAGQRCITAEPGDTVSLPCRAPDHRTVLVVEWSRTGLESEYVLLFRNNQPDPERQHSSFKNRVDLQDRQMKDGDVSLVLKNVTTEDTRTYECRVKSSQTHRRKRSVLKSEPLSIIQLQVSPPGGPGGRGHHGGPGGHTGLVVALVVSAAVILAVIVVIVRRRLSLYHPPFSS